MSGRNFSVFRELCGDTTLKNILLVTNMWGDVSPDDGDDRENELSSEYFKSALSKGARMVRHHNTVKSAHDIIRMIMGNHPVVLQIQRELVDEHKAIGETAAGVIINRELKEQARRHQIELEKVEERMKQALENKEQETREELEEERKKLQERIDKAKKDWEASYAAEKERMEVRVKEMEREIKWLRDLTGTLVVIPIYK